MSDFEVSPTNGGNHTFVCSYTTDTWEIHNPRIIAANHAKAAELFVEDNDGGMANGDRVAVWVRQYGSGTIKRFNVESSIVKRYIAYGVPLEFM